MPTVSELMSRNISNALTNVKTWGGLIFNVKEYGAVGNGIHDDTEAIKKAISACVEAGGGEVHFPPGDYVISDTIVLDSRVVLVGYGLGEWDLVFPNRKKTPAITQLRFTGNPAKTYELTYATDMSAGGGVLTNPSSTNGFLNDKYKLINFRNEDATTTSPATTRKMAVGVYVPKGKMAAGIRNMRLVLNYNGIDGYNDTSLNGLGDDWDVGIFIDNAQDNIFEDVQIVGYWRIAAVLIGAGSLGYEFQNAGAERNIFYRCTFQGFSGVCIRGGDAYRVTAMGGSAGNYTVEIPYTNSNPLPTSGVVRLVGTYLTYTSYTVNGDKLTLQGIPVDPSGTGYVGAPLRISPYSTGVAGTAFWDCYIGGLEHTSNKSADHPDIGLGVSKNIEISGNPIRGIRFFSCQIQGNEEILVHLHDCDDIQFFGCFFEAGGVEGKVAGTRFIASPRSNALSARGTYPCGETTNVEFHGSDFSLNVDKASRFVRAAGAISRFGPQSGTDKGFFDPRFCFDSYETFPYDETDLLIRAPYGRRIILQDEDRNDILSITSGGSIEVGGRIARISGQQHVFDASGYDFRVNAVNKVTIFSTGNVEIDGVTRPKVDNAYTLGSSSLRWSTVYAATGTINTSDAREKTDVQDEPLGLEFIKKLRPVQFKYKESGNRDEQGNPIPGMRPHHGLIAQEVKTVLDELGIDHAAYIEAPVTETDEEGKEVPTGEVRYGLRYTELLSSIIKAIQELAQKVGA